MSRAEQSRAEQSRAEQRRLFFKKTLKVFSFVGLPLFFLRPPKLQSPFQNININDFFIGEAYAHRTINMGGSCPKGHYETCGAMHSCCVTFCEDY